MKYNFVIVSMFKNESLILKEWFEHHISVGVDHFFIINNGSTDESEKITLLYSKYITYIYDPMVIFSPTNKEVVMWDEKTQNIIQKQRNVTFQQYMVNKHFLKLIKTTSQWVAFIDCDEYLYLPVGSGDANPSITHLLTNLKPNVTRIFIPWKKFGSNGHIAQPISIRKGFLLRNNRHVSTGNYWGFGKSIEKVTEVCFLCPHRSELFRDHTVLPDLEPLTSETIKTFSYDKNNVICCNHYITMSRYYYENCKGKRTGGSTNMVINNTNYWERNDNKPDDIIDRGCADAVTTNLPVESEPDSEFIAYYGVGQTYRDVTRYVLKSFKTQEGIVIPSQVILNQVFGDPVVDQAKYFVVRQGYQLSVYPEANRPTLRFTLK
jgi:hypothetical protein